VEYFNIVFEALLRILQTYGNDMLENDNLNEDVENSDKTRKKK